MSSLTKTELQAILDQYKAEADSAWDNLVASVMDREGERRWVRTGFGGALKVNSSSYGNVPDDMLDAVIAGEVAPIEVIATDDGRIANIYEWHNPVLDGDQSDEETVYVERWTAEGRTFHGYVDAVSRKVVQTG